MLIKSNSRMTKPSFGKAPFLLYRKGILLHHGKLLILLPSKIHFCYHYIAVSLQGVNFDFTLAYNQFHSFWLLFPSHLQVLVTICISQFLFYRLTEVFKYFIAQSFYKGLPGDFLGVYENCSNIGRQPDTLNRECKFQWDRSLSNDGRSDISHSFGNSLVGVGFIRCHFSRYLYVKLAYMQL